jgi:prophage antirepressor-like protein
MQINNLFKKEKVEIKKYKDSTYYNIEDIATNICDSSNPIRSRNKIKNKTKINKVWFVKLNTALQYISKSRSNNAKIFIKKYNKIKNETNSDSDESESDDSEYDESDSEDDNDNTIINLYKNIYKYRGTSVKLIRTKNEIWFKGKDIANILKYKNTRKALIDNIDENDKKSYNTIKKMTSMGNQQLPIEGNILPDTIFINQIGLFSLVMKSKMEDAINFKKWICKDLLPKVFSYGTYSFKPIDLKKYNYYDNKLLSEYTNIRVVYLAYIGEHDGESFIKFGMSGDFPRRELKKHRKTFKIFNVLHIEPTDAMEAVEKRMKIEFGARGMIRTMMINKKNQTELIALNSHNGVESCIDLIKQIVSNTKLKSHIEYENEIKNLKNKYNNDIKNLKKDHNVEIIILKKEHDGDVKIFKKDIEMYKELIKEKNIQINYLKSKTI